MGLHDRSGKVGPKAEVLADLDIHIRAEIHPKLLVIRLVVLLISVPETALTQDVEVGIEPHVLVTTGSVQRDSLLI